MTSKLAEERTIGSYRLTHLLGHGGFANVYLGKHIYLNTYAAVKVLNTLFPSEDEVKRFHTEACMLARLKHRHIVGVIDFSLHQSTPYLVLEYAPRGTLRQQIPNGTPLPLAAVLPFVLQIASALQFIHAANVIHCDVKPGNLLLGLDKEIWLSDFGSAKVAKAARTFVDQDFSGTLAYAAPEQLAGRPLPTSDQYALAVMVYEWLCGRLPFQGSALSICSQQVYEAPPAPREWVASISPTVERVILKAMAKESQKRFPNVMEFALALKQANLAEPAESQGVKSFARSQPDRYYTEFPSSQPLKRQVSNVPAAALLYA